jgi:hypothetical protein
VAGAHNVEHAADNVFRARITDAGWPYARTDVDTLAASLAGVEHVLDSTVEGGLESDFAHWLPI